MDEDLPFLHLPEDPSPDRTDRALARCRRALDRRRRTRRTLLVGLPLVLLAALGALAAAGALPGGDDHEDVATGPDPEPTLSVDPDTPWFGGTLSADGRTLTVYVGSQPLGDGPCMERFRHDVVETGGSVVIGFERIPSTVTSTAPEVCSLALVQHEVEIHLGEPLGDRPVFDGIDPDPQPISRRAEVVEATWLPDGFERTGVDPLEPEDPEGGAWQQMFTKEGADWYVNVNQQAAGSRDQPEESSTPVTVHGIEGERITGQMNGTMESIHWVEGGLDLTVWGEMQGPPTFTHSDELLRVAEGVRVPSD